MQRQYILFNKYQSECNREYHLHYRKYSRTPVKHFIEYGTFFTLSAAKEEHPVNNGQNCSDIVHQLRCIRNSAVNSHHIRKFHQVKDNSVETVRTALNHVIFMESRPFLLTFLHCTDNQNQKGNRQHNTAVGKTDII